MKLFTLFLHAFIVTEYRVLVLVDGQVNTIHFTAVLASDGSRMCATDPPYTSTVPVRSQVLCAVQCTHDKMCTDFNYHDKLNRCDRYHSSPISYSAVNGCVSKTVSHLPSLIVNTDICSSNIDEQISFLN